MKSDPITARFKRIATGLSFVVEAARLRLEALAIVVTDTSNAPTSEGFQSNPHSSWDFVRTSFHSPYTARTVATIRFTPAGDSGQAEAYSATWRAEAWENSDPSFHTVQGAVAIGLENLSYGSFERLVLALLRRAAPAFPELLENMGWPGFPDLPSLRDQVDYLVQIRAFHKQMVEPWSGPPIGCSEAEILELELRLGWRLPLAYKQYLAFMGADRRGVFVGCDWFIEAAGINNIDFELAYMEVNYTPRGDTLTFMSHQGYMFGWLDLPIASDDPPVYFYTESSKENAIELHPRFTDLLLAELEHMSYFLRRLGKRLS